MSNKKSTSPWPLVTSAFLFGGLVVWLWKKFTQPAAPSPKPPKPSAPVVSPADYETWLDWLINYRIEQPPLPPIPDLSPYRTWLDPIYDRIPLHWLLTSIGISLLTFLFGLVLAVVFGFFSLFIRTPAIYLAVFGTAMGLAAFRWVGQAFPPAFGALAPYFGVSTEEYAEFINRWLERMYNKRAMLTISMIVVLSSFAAMVAVFLFPVPTISTLERIAPSLVLLDQEWYFGGASAAKMLIIDLYFLINFTIVISGAWLCVHALLILYGLSKKSTILPIPTIMTLKLRVIVNIFVVVCLVWLVGVAVFVLLFYEALDLLSIVWIGSQAILTMATFLLPQYLSHRIILNLREELITATRLAYDKYFRQFEAHSLDPQKRLELINQLAERASSLKSWPAEPFDWLMMLAGQALPPLVAFARTWIKNFLP